MVDQLLIGEEEVASWIKSSRKIRSIFRIPGDASTRRYYRIKAVDGSSFILMQMESFEDLGMELPFVVVQAHLLKAGVDVPAILDVDPKRGFILLEDLTDVTLLRRLQEVASADVERHIYERVIDSLVHLQFHASPKVGGPVIEAFKLRFDHEKLLWEMDNTVEHFYELYLKRAIRPEDRRILSAGMSEICTILSNEPTVLAHRDFHSRNIMLPTDEEGRLVMIDFQDARMGPAQYDLASLLKDSYYQLEETQISRLLDYYVARWEAVSGERLDTAHFRYIFDLMSVQRNFKAIGSFASFLNRRGDAGYVKYIGNTFENIRRTLLKYPQYSKLREILFHYYYF